MEKDQCKGKVWDGDREYPCSRKAVIDGYCTQHNPVDAPFKWDFEQINPIQKLSRNDYIRLKTSIDPELELHAMELEKVKKAIYEQVGGDHYKTFKIQPVEFIQRNNLGFCEGAAIKYLCRHKKKGGLEDLKKAKHFIDLLIELEYPDGDKH